AGVELKGHLSSHGYRISDALSFPIFKEGWSAAEELVLVNAIRKYGLGNWEDVAGQVALVNPHCKRTCREIREHYLDDYLGYSGSVLPSRCLDPSPSGEVIYSGVIFLVHHH
ncbi:unnamed protein product, partial [Chrysoparadoxa australica]